MRIATFDPQTRRISSVIEYPPDRVSEVLLNIPEGKLAVEVQAEVSPHSHYIGDDDLPQLYPPKPTRYSVWVGSEWLPISLQSEEEELRIKRTAYLAASDWTQLPDAPLTEEQRAAWRTYRQALRDLPETGQWPAPPSE